MVDIIVDGIYCSKCNDMHPSLFWHEKYNDYLSNRKKSHKKICKKFGIKTHYLNGLNLKKCKSGKCVICGCMTNYKDTRTKKYICSNECKYQQNI